MKKMLRVNPDFIIQRVGKKIGIYDAENSMLYTLNSTAAAIFLGFQLSWSREKIIKKISLQYKKAEDEVAADVAEAISEMIKIKILI